MKSITQFIALLVAGLNSKLGLTLATDATADEVIDAVNGAKDLETIKAEIKAELAAEQDTKLAELNTRMDELTARVETLQQENTALAAERDQLQATADELEAEQATWNTDRKGLEAQIVTLKGRRAATGAGESNSDTPDIKQFQTVENFYGTLEPANGSKF